MASSSLLLFTSLLPCLAELCLTQTAPEYSRNDFSSNFVFGAGTSANQYEGAAAEDGRTPSIWDTYAHAGKMPDNSTGDVACDGYHKYKEDVKLMADTGLEAYRFSISWSRLLPNGRGAVNPKGLKYYNNVINELIEHGIQPHVTLYHLDLPQVLEDEYGGWLSPKIINDYKEYADVCFGEFGNRVSSWTTIIEPNIIGQGAYDVGGIPPQHCSYPFGVTNCSTGNSTVEPYIVVHNILLAHAAVANLYRIKYQGAQEEEYLHMDSRSRRMEATRDRFEAIQNGLIGLSIFTIWFYPWSNSSADVEATKRVREFEIGWVMNPLVFGDYPGIMKKNVGERLPSFTKAQSEKVKGSFDFIGLNHYYSAYVKDKSNGPISGLRDYNADMFATISVSKNETPSGPFIPASIVSDPPGLQNMLEYLKHTYENPPIYIQENGFGLGANNSLNDTARINYLSSYIGSMLAAIRDGSDVRGYFVWSFMDLFELLTGYQSGCGLYYVDFLDDNRKRQPKLSAHWYSNFLMEKNGIHIKWAGMQRMSHTLQ